MTDAQKRPTLLTAADVAEILGISTKMGRYLMMEMPCINIGRGRKQPRLVVYESDFWKWMDNRRTCAADVPADRKARPRRSSISYDGLLDANGHIPMRKTK